MTILLNIELDQDTMAINTFRKFDLIRIRVVQVRERTKTWRDR